MLTALGQDFRFSFRQLRKHPGFTAVAVSTLALAIGANTAIFSVVNAVILNPLPFQQPDQLVLVKERIPMASPEPIPVSAPDVVQLQRQNHVFTDVAAFNGEAFDLSGTGTPQRVVADRINANLFPLLGVEPMLGRSFTSDEDQPGHTVAILSYGLWQRHFGSKRGVVGQPIILNGQPYTVAGVMPRNFEFPLPGMAQGDPADVFVPMAFTHEELSNIGDNFNFSVMARVRPGVRLQQANAELKAIAHRIQEGYPAQVRNELQLEALALPLKDQVVGRTKPLLFLLLGAVGFVLLIACANIANLLLSRAADRQREVGVRRALGAGQWHLLRQLLIESMLLVVPGSGLGLLLTFWTTKALIGIMPTDISRVHQVRVDPSVLAFTIALTVVTGLIFGSIPAIAVSRSDLTDALNRGGRSAVHGPSHQRFRAALVVAEIALSLVLLVGAGLLLRSFQRVLDTSPGFQPEHVLTASLHLPEARYKDDQQVRDFYRELTARLDRLPGVKAAGASTDLPLEAGWLELFTPEGYQPPPGAGLNTCNHSVILHDYLQSMEVPLIRGRYFTAQDRAGLTHVLIVSQSLAERYWPNQDPIGKRLKQGPPESPDPWLTIVGVVGDVKQSSLDVATMMHTYEPYAQYVPPARSLNLAIRATGNPASLSSELTATVWGLDRELAVAQIRTMDQVISQSTSPRRFNLYLLAGFAVLALLLASIGIYGVIAYAVVNRTHEIGIRVALGAHRRDVLRLVVGEGLRLAMIGVALGCIAALGLMRLLTSFLYEVRPTDPLTFIVGIALLAGIAALAAYIPARRAANVDPIVALRYE